MKVYALVARALLALGVGISGCDSCQEIPRQTPYSEHMETDPNTRQEAREYYCLQASRMDSQLTGFLKDACKTYCMYFESAGPDSFDNAMYPFYGPKDNMMIVHGCRYSIDWKPETFCEAKATFHISFTDAQGVRQTLKRTVGFEFGTTYEYNNPHWDTKNSQWVNTPGLDEVLGWKPLKKNYGILYERSIRPKGVSMHPEMQRPPKRLRMKNNGPKMVPGKLLRRAV